MLIFGRVDVFVWLLGFIALGLESTLPIPQFITSVTFVFKHRALTVLHLVITSRSLYMGSGCQHYWVGLGETRSSTATLPCSSPNRKIHDFIAGWSTFSYKGALSSSRFVQFSNCQWTLVCIGEASLWLDPNHRLAAIVLQRLSYGNAPPSTALGEDDDLEQALVLAEE